jgi:hypothetical protein
MTSERLGLRVIKSEMAGTIYDSDERSTLVKFMIDAMVRMESAFKEPLADINRGLHKRERASVAYGNLVSSP